MQTCGHYIHLNCYMSYIETLQVVKRGGGGCVSGGCVSGGCDGGVCVSGGCDGGVCVSGGFL